mmetsp:Transcript_38937/g.63080  ORF Transcript_38937/g.63080 Transcript_38937/m.63080 type:complete len:203 (+) Transcript_38937:3044-3652(+)
MVSSLRLAMRLQRVFSPGRTFFGKHSIQDEESALDRQTSIPSWRETVLLARFTMVELSTQSMLAPHPPFSFVQAPVGAGSPAATGSLSSMISSVIATVGLPAKYRLILPTADMGVAAVSAVSSHWDPRPEGVSIDVKGPPAPATTLNMLPTVVTTAPFRLAVREHLEEKPGRRILGAHSSQEVSSGFGKHIARVPLMAHTRL